jgi:hypothetical protein
MATSILYRLPVFALVALLAACGGGGDSGSATTASASSAAPGGCLLSTVETGRQVDRIQAAQDVRSFGGFGVQSRLFGPIIYTNNTAATTRLQVSLSAQRHIEAPAGMVGTTDLLLSISVVDESLNQLVPTSGDGCPPAVDDMPAGTAATVSESHRFNLTVLPGHTIHITSLASVAPSVGSVGDVVLTTSSLDFSVSEL